jgi:hypothetical protein
MREKFNFTVSASKAKSILCDGQANRQRVRALKRESHRRMRRGWAQHLARVVKDNDAVDHYPTIKPVTSWDVC